MQIPDDKRYFRIGEVSRLTSLEPYVLRYWESEFPQIRPRRADSNQRTYRKEDLEIMKKWGWYLDLSKRHPEKPLPRWMLKCLAFNRVKD